MRSDIASISDFLVILLRKMKTIQEHTIHPRLWKEKQGCIKKKENRMELRDSVNRCGFKCWLILKGKTKKMK